MSTWIKAALIRALKTCAQTAVAAVGMVAIGGGTPALEEVNWLYVGSVSLTAGILSILTSLAGLPEVEQEKELRQLKNDNEDLKL